MNRVVLLGVVTIPVRDWPRQATNSLAAFGKRDLMGSGGGGGWRHVFQGRLFLFGRRAVIVGDGVFATLNQSGSTNTGAYSQAATSHDTYTIVETGTKVLTNPSGVYSSTDTLTASDATTLVETGNDLTGQFQRTVNGTMTGSLVEAGTSRGASFSFPSSPSTTYVLIESGNLVNGSLSLTETGVDRYTILEQSNNPSNAVSATAPATSITRPLARH
jgi:hypothetical protein